MNEEKSVRFARATTTEPWLDFLERDFALQRTRILELREFGALYLNQKRWLPEPEARVQAGDVVRVHTQPKRFPLPLLNAGHLREESRDWVLIWKPSGLPSHETLDNLRENAKRWTEDQLGLRLWSLNRLDVGTRGWLLFAKTRSAAASFHGSLERREVMKVYETLSPQPSRPTGLWEHWMKRSDRSPKVLAREASAESDLLCRSRVTEMEPRAGLGFRCRVELVTGRTHQIRAQFAFEGSPLHGDSLYGSRVGSGERFEKFALSCEKLAFTDAQGVLRSFERPPDFPSLAEDWDRTPI